MQSLANTKPDGGNEMQQAIRRILKTAALYFALVFGAGFALGTIRVLWAVPAFGERAAELMETPVMFVVTLFAARWIIRRFAPPPAAATTGSRLAVGVVALGLLLASEFSVVLWLRGLSLREYFASRDPVSGTVYLVMLGVFAVMPLFVDRRRFATGLGRSRA